MTLRRAVELVLLGSTFLALVATSHVRGPCAAETVTFLSQSTCGPTGLVTLTSTSDCRVTSLGALDAGLPEFGIINDVPDGGFSIGFELNRFTDDGGIERCDAFPVGQQKLNYICNRNSRVSDGGVETVSSCTGDFTPSP